MNDVAKEVLENIRIAAISHDGHFTLSPMFNLTAGGHVWAAQVWNKTKKVGPFICADQADNTPAGALKALARVLELAEQT